MTPIDGRWHGKLVAAALIAVVFALYLPELHAPFEYDDKPEILDNLVLRDPARVGEMVAYNPFRVLLLYTFAWDLWAWGFRPFGYRLLNITIHAINVVLLLQGLTRLRRLAGISQRVLPFAAAGAAFFAVHPLAIESVTYISGRSASLATTFVLASLLCWLRMREIIADPQVAAALEPRSRRARWGLGLILAATVLGAVPAVLIGAARGWSTDQALVRALLLSGTVAVVLLAIQRRKKDDVIEGPAGTAATTAARLYTAAWVLFVLGCLTKEIAGVTPGLLLLTEVTTRRSWRVGLRQLGGSLLPFFGVPLFLVALRVAAYGYVAAPHFIRPWTTNLLTQVEVVAQYARLWCVPWPLSIQHEWAVVAAPGRPLTWMLLAAELAVGWLAVRSVGRRPLLSWGLLAALAALLPESSVFALKETMVEHRTYLPSIAVAALFGTLVADGPIRRTALLLPLVGVMLSGWATVHRSYSDLWNGEERLWRHATEVNPRAASAWRYLGDLHVRQGRWSDAEAAFLQTIEISPTYAEAYNKLGHVLAVSGRLPDAKRRFEEALVFAPCLSPAWNNLAALSLRDGDVDGAVQKYESSLRCEPQDYRAHRGLAEIYDRKLRQPRRAAEHYAAALAALDPYHPDAAGIKRRLLEITF